MIDRPFWSRKIQETWKRASIVWLTGVRRSGKTTLCQSIPGARYLNCDLPRTASLLEDPESFFSSVKEPVLILDEVHQLSDPSRTLKIGADEFPRLKILATGSSSLSATHKFRDSLTGRKRSVVLLPVLHQELSAFGVKDLRERLFRGGLPQALLSPRTDEGFYSEWLDSYFARDVQELFHVEKRSGFLRLLETLLRQSGGLAEPTSLARSCGLSRPTIMNYLEVYQLTHAIHILRPYHGGGRQEILQQPKIYGFDTGFVRHVKGWGELREGDLGLLWEHLVLDALLCGVPDSQVYFWRTKQKEEVDFVIPAGRDRIHAVECKWSPRGFDAGPLRAFRALHPSGRNVVVSPSIHERHAKKDGKLTIDFVPLDLLAESLDPPV
ncbi:MAG: ATPase [Elusimicrobia bacterium RIFCSPLOWO2_01_FULL_60_11]|nr:MAG: ATPase [Elusimicrobia bacterium RIFCSPLOWO2_01_FULL_60_11]